MEYWRRFTKARWRLQRARRASRMSRPTRPISSFRRSQSRRTARDLLNTLASVAEKKAAFRSLSDSWADTTTPHGRLMLTVLGGLAEFRARAYSRPNRGGSRARERARGAARAEAEADPASSPRLWGAVTQASRWLRLADPATLPIQPYRACASRRRASSSSFFRGGTQSRQARSTATFPHTRRWVG